MNHPGGGTANNNVSAKAVYQAKHVFLGSSSQSQLTFATETRLWALQISWVCGGGAVAMDR